MTKWGGVVSVKHGERDSRYNRDMDIGAAQPFEVLASKPQKPTVDVADEAKKFSKTFLDQILGREGKTPSEEDVATKDKKDKQFSETAYNELVRQMYEIHRAKRKKELELEKKREQDEAQAEKMAEVNQLRRVKEVIRPEVAKTRAEIKNFGAE